MRTGPAATLDDHVARRLLEERVVVLGSEVRDDVAASVCSQLLLLAVDDPRADVRLHISCSGGSVAAGLAVLDTMRFIGCDVVTVAVGVAGSIGQVLLSAGTPGKRLALPHARVVLHQPSGGTGSAAADVRVRSEQMAVMRGELAQVNAANTGQPLARVVADSERETWFSAQEAQAYGLVDRVVEVASAL